MVLRTEESKLQDQSQVDGIRNGGAELDQAISSILIDYGPKIVNYLKSRYGNKEDAEDLLHDGLAVLILNVRSNKFRGESSLYSYLFSICKQMQSKIIRKNVAKENWERYKLDEPAASRSPEVRMIKSDMKKYVESMLNKLGDKCRKVLSMWSMSYSMSEIAAELAYANAQVAMNKKNKCMKELSALVQNEHQSSPFW